LGVAGRHWQDVPRTRLAGRKVPYARKSHQGEGGSID